MSTITEFRWPQARHVASTLRQPFFRICPSVIQGMGFEDQPIVLPIAELKLDQVSKGSIAIRQRARPASGSASSSPWRSRACPCLRLLPPPSQECSVPPAPCPFASRLRLVRVDQPTVQSPARLPEHAAPRQRAHRSSGSCGRVSRCMLIGPFPPRVGQRTRAA